jgi:hypothetical protein
MRNPHRRASWAWSGPVLVDALLDDGDLDAAWAAAKDAASEPQWLRLADASVTSRPADALAVYHRTIGSLKTQTGDDNYRRIASLLRSVRDSYWDYDWRRKNRRGGRYPEHELWEAVEGYLDLLDAPESPRDPPVTGGKMDLPPR